MDNEHHVKKAFLISMIVSLSISVLIGIVIFLLGSFGETQTRILLTTLTIVGFSLAGLCSATLYDKQNYVQPVRNYSCSIGVYCYNCSYLDILGVGKVCRFGLTLILLSFTFSHVSLLLLIDTERSSVKASLIGTILFIALVAFSLLAVIWDLIRFEQFYIRLFGVFAILDVLGTIITPIIYKVTKMKQQDTSFSQTY
ncbi:hypothetical protein J4461_02140 [Candidatus Pacearchaeota archaeon]|nr:hypothetical protein [Candidatus Pacearchaeota archaeon]